MFYRQGIQFLDGLAYRDAVRHGVGVLPPHVVVNRPSHGPQQEGGSHRYGAHQHLCGKCGSGRSIQWIALVRRTGSISSLTSTPSVFRPIGTLRPIRPLRRFRRLRRIWNIGQFGKIGIRHNITSDHSHRAVHLFGALEFDSPMHMREKGQACIWEAGRA